MVTAVVLAGGLGTRLRAAVPDLPKPMAPVGGRPFLEHLLDHWTEQGVDRFVLSVGYKHEAVRSHFGNRYRAARIEYAIETEPLGTGGGLLMAAEQAGCDFCLVLNGDTHFPVSLTSLTEFAGTREAQWCFSLFRSDQTGRYMGMELDADGRVVALKATAVSGRQLVNGGVYWMSSNALRELRLPPGKTLSLENEVLPLALASGQRLYGFPVDAPFLDIGIPDDYLRAAAHFEVLSATTSIGMP